MEERDFNEEMIDETLPADVVVSDEDDPIESEDPIEATAAAGKTAEDDPAPAEPPKPKKKRKLKKWQIALICVGGFILLLGIAIGIFFLVGTLNAHPRESMNVEFHNKAPNFAVSYTSEELAIINKGMSDDATEAEIILAISTIYNKANYNKIHNTPNAVAVLRGEGSAALEIAGQKPSGTMIVRGFRAQAGDEYYYQKAAPIMKCSIPALQDTLEDMLNQQERAYSNGKDDFRATPALKGPDSKILTDEDEIELATIPFVKVDVPAKTKIRKLANQNAFNSFLNYLEDPREITNFVVNESTIILKPLKEGEKYIEFVEAEDGMGYYVCRFSLDVENDECVEKSRTYLRASANSTDLNYGHFDIVLDVWENGYLKQMHDDEEWHGTVTKGPISSTTSSETWYETIVFYDFDADLFSEEDAAEYEGEDWVAKLIAHYKEEIDNA